MPPSRKFLVSFAGALGAWTALFGMTSACGRTELSGDASSLSDGSGGVGLSSTGGAGASPGGTSSAGRSSGGAALATGGRPGAAEVELGGCTFDAELARLVRQRLPSFSQDVSSLTFLEVRGPLKSLRGIECLRNLKSFTATNFEESPLDLSPLAALANLTDLSLSEGTYTHLDTLSGLPVNTLKLSAASVGSLEPLLKFAELRDLSLDKGPLPDPSEVAALRALERLTLSELPVVDLAFLGGMPELQGLTLNRLAHSDLSGLEDLPQLVTLNLEGPRIKSLVGLRNVRQLATLSVANCEDLTSLDGLEVAQSLVHLSVQDTPRMDDIGTVANLPGLASFSISGSGVSDLSPLANCPSLHTLSAPSNFIEDVEILRSLSLVTDLNVSGNQVSDLEPLTGRALKRLNVADNQISSIAPLTGMPLIYLSISDNPIDSLEPLRTLVDLETLSMDNVGASSLESLRGLFLRELSAAHNLIEDIDSVPVEQMLALNLSANRIVELPAMFRGAQAASCPDTDLRMNPLSSSSISMLMDLCENYIGKAGFLWGEKDCKCVFE